MKRNVLRSYQPDRVNQTFLDAGMDGFFTDNPDIGAEVALPEEAFAS